MRILLIVSAFNSLSQRIFVDLKELGHSPAVIYAASENEMQKKIQDFNPDVIVCPYLKKKLPKTIWENKPTFIIHPGIMGDRGAYSLDWAILEKKQIWGVTIIKANDILDGGDIFASEEFAMRSAPKASIYRHEVATAASKALKNALKNLENKDFTPKKLDYADKEIKGRAHPFMTQNERKIEWQKETTDEIIKKIYASDSFPGVLDEFFGVECYLFGAQKEEFLRGNPKEILAKRDGAVCVGTIDGALWISHMKEKEKMIKLPAAFVLKEKLLGVRENRIPLILEEKRETFKEIFFEEKDSVGYLYFEFHNGAMSAHQCVRLKYAIESVIERDIKVLVLMGGEDFFCNGIHLNIMEDSKKKAEDGWSNLHSMNELARTIIFSTNIITVSALRGGAGAGGVSLAGACDFVVAKDGTVLNPHYMNLGLFGSEYWTYTLPKKIGAEKADELMQKCMPIGAQEAKRIKLVDEVFDENIDKFTKELQEFCSELAKSEDYHDLLLKKREKLKNDELEKSIDSYKEEELKKSYDSFYDENSLFHKLRYEFVHKLCQTQTPKRFKDA
ncbi:MAG: putative two-component system protein hydrogenase maturation factor HypX/HoxX [Campylobacterota bacterium]|nr:putative two-component system protein hydrogenase maturation factor HypX/HoxX [Campylobacterota bacterium]